MQYRRANIAVSAALAMLLMSPATARPDTPPLLWNDAKTLGIQCLVQRGPLRNDSDLGTALCARAARLAARGSPVPVKLIPLGDPALLAPGTVAMLIHASIETVYGRGAIAFSIRPFRAAADQSAVLFAAAPRIVPSPGAALPGAELDSALAGALAELLPWQARPAGARPIR